MFSGKEDNTALRRSTPACAGYEEIEEINHQDPCESESVRSMLLPQEAGMSLGDQEPRTPCKNGTSYSKGILQSLSLAQKHASTQANHAGAHAKAYLEASVSSPQLLACMLIFAFASLSLFIVCVSISSMQINPSPTLHHYSHAFNFPAAMMQESRLASAKTDAGNSSTHPDELHLSSSNKSNADTMPATGASNLTK
jgi:hypothetical protein